MDNGVDSITVEDHVVDADVGVALKLKIKKGVEIDFNVEDSAGATPEWPIRELLDNAESVTNVGLYQR